MPSKKTTEQFIKDAKEKRTDIDFDYSKVLYVNSITKVTIIDPDFGEFYISPNSFLSGKGHPARGGTAKKSTEQFIKDAKEKRTDIDFDYSKVLYVNSITKVTIVDPEFGEFQIRPKNFLRGYGHPIRALRTRRAKNSKTIEQFIKDAKEKRTDINFDYSKVVYINALTKVTIIDPVFGEFQVTPANFLNGQDHPVRAGKSQQYAYINSILDNNLLVALKYGIEKQKGKRVNQQNKKSLFTVESLCVYCFPTVEQCKDAERECKKLFGNGFLTKEEMPDGYTETTTIANLEKIISIYEKWGGVKQ